MRNWISRHIKTAKAHFAEIGGSQPGPEIPAEAKIAQANMEALRAEFRDRARAADTVIAELRRRREETRS